MLGSRVQGAYRKRQKAGSLILEVRWVADLLIILLCDSGSVAIMVGFFSYQQYYLG